MEISRQTSPLSCMRRERCADHSYKTAKVHELPFSRVLLDRVSPWGKSPTESSVGPMEKAATGTCSVIYSHAANDMENNVNCAQRVARDINCTRNGNK